MGNLTDMARQLGNAMARTDEYQALQRAVSAADDDRDLVEARNAMAALEQRVAELMQRAEEPDDAMREEYEATFSRLQTNTSYQRLVAAQTNFDKVLVQVNETISKGMEEGAHSRIILSS